MQLHFGAVTLSISDSWETKRIFRIARKSGFSECWKNSALRKTLSIGNRFSMPPCTQCLLLGRMWSRGLLNAAAFIKVWFGTLCTLSENKGSEKEVAKSLQLPFFFVSSPSFSWPPCPLPVIQYSHLQHSSNKKEIAALSWSWKIPGQKSVG